MERSVTCVWPPVLVGVAVSTPKPPRSEVLHDHAPIIMSSLCGLVGALSNHTPLDTPARNLFTPSRAGLIRNDQDDHPPELQPQALFLDEVSSDEHMHHSQSSRGSLPRSQSRSSKSSLGRRSTDSTITAITASQAWSSSDTESDSNNYLETCRLLGLSPMVQPAKRRRC